MCRLAWSAFVFVANLWGKCVLLRNKLDQKISSVCCCWWGGVAVQSPGAMRLGQPRQCVFTGSIFKAFYWGSFGFPWPAVQSSWSFWSKATAPCRASSGFPFSSSSGLSPSSTNTFRSDSSRHSYWTTSRLPKGFWRESEVSCAHKVGHWCHSALATKIKRQSTKRFTCGAASADGVSLVVVCVFCWESRAGGVGHGVGQVAGEVIHVKDVVFGRLLHREVVLGPVFPLPPVFHVDP